MLCPEGSGGRVGEFLRGALWVTREGGTVGGGKDLKEMVEVIGYEAAL